MGNLVEFLVRVKDLASGPLGKIGSTGSRAFVQMEQNLSKVTGRFNRLDLSIRDMDKRIDQLRKTREISLDTRQIRRATSEIEALERRKRRLEGGSGGGFSMMGLTGSVMAAAGAAAGLGSFFSLGMEKEQTKLSFATMLGGSAERSNALLGKLKQFSNDTPFSDDEVIGSGRSLLAFGFGENEILPSLRRVGDVASGLKIPFGELSEIYGKARVQGTLFAEDLNQLAGRGIPIFTELAKVLQVPPGEIKKLASESKITFPMMEQAFINMTGKGGLFDDMMKKQSQTVGGKWSTVMGQAKTLLTVFSESLLPLVGGLVDAAGWLLEHATGVKSLAGGLLAGAAAYGAITMGVKLWKVATGQMTLAQWGLNTAMLANPVFWVAAGVAALVTGVIYAWNKVEGFRSFLYGFAESAMQLFRNIGTFIASIFAPVVEALNAFQNPNLSAREKTKTIGKSIALMSWNLSPAGLAANAIGFAAKGGFTNGIVEANARGRLAGIAAFRKGNEGEPGTSPADIFSAAPGVDSSLATSSPVSEANRNITGGGVRSVTINLGKFFDDLHIHAASTSEGIDQMEQKILDVFLRIVNSGNATQGN